jgi:hypothetical protein
MLIKFFKKLSFIIIIWGYLFTPISLFAEKIINVDATSLLPKAEIFISPRSGNFLVDSTFDAPIYLNTKGNNINAVSVKLSFDPRKLSIIKPSGGKSIFGIWVEPPSYDNAKGTASLVGLIPGGIVTSSGLIATVTFKVLIPGETNVKITDYSSANLNDGLGTDVRLSLGGAFYTLTPKTPEGVSVYSDTHPLEDRWYNNNSPFIKWDSPLSVDGYSIALDSNPGTIPETVINTNNSFISYENVKDGVWYFHVRAKVKGVWGNTSNFQVKIDTSPPAKFTPQVKTVEDSNTKKYLVSFISTDSLSGVDHYEVGSVDQGEGNIASPIFIETESPYLVPTVSSNMIKVFVRVFDTAGNMQESEVNLYPGFTFWQTVKGYSLYILGFIILLLLLEIIAHFLFGHHIFSHVRKAYNYFRKISSNESSVENNLVGNNMNNMNIMVDPNTLLVVPKPPQSDLYYSQNFHKDYNLEYVNNRQINNQNKP